ncbi:SRPBCC family protein [Paraburkholderia sp. 22B1P]|uniref:CoxG family protein n=1 Tax=Paraburkholderia sp. 22B1P TaxID=3080498 RepID=UPI003089ECE4|nr:SRPBCC family protein [Paraburkholderia sp. 22B1P]
MEFEKKVVIDAPIQKVWDLLLDPNVMAGCVPGTESVDVISDVEYLASVKVKISFISARFRIRTTVLETRAPYYLKSEGTGEDSSVGSSLKQASELTLAEIGDEKTELVMKIKVDVFGRLGSFGLTVMKTKADRMWEEFGANLNARALAGTQQGVDIAGSSEKGRVDDEESVVRADKPIPVGIRPKGGGMVQRESSPGRDQSSRGSWWQRLLPNSHREDATYALRRLSTDIYIEVQRGESTVRVLWPAQDSRDCVAWLKDYLK